MLKIKKGCNAYKLLEIIFVCGDYPVERLDMLGNRQVYRNLINEMSSVQDYENIYSKERVRKVKVLTVIGKAKFRTVRFLPSAKLLTKWLGSVSDKCGSGSRTSGSERYIRRRHRIAVGAVMFRNAGIEYRPYILPKLQNDKIKYVVPETPCFYLSDALKRVGDKDVNIIRYSRIIGMFYNGQEGYAVYNALNESMLWFRFDELKVRENMAALSRYNGIKKDLTKAIIFGNSYEVALMTLTGYDKIGKRNLKIDGVYRKVYFIPANEFGYRVLKFFTVADAEELISSGLFVNPCHTDFNYSRFDLINGPEHYISFLTGDIAKLKWFKEQMSYTSNRYYAFKIVCFREQVDFIDAYLGGKAEIKVARIEDVEQVLGLNGDKDG